MKELFQKYQNAKFESAAAVQSTQTDMLRLHLDYVRKHSPAYQKQLENLSVDTKTFELKDLPQLPFTEKRDIEADPASFLAVEKKLIADIVLSSGTTGRPLQILYTAGDLERLAYNEEQSFAGCGIVNGDVALLTCTMDRCFVAGLAYFLGMRARGATVIRNGHGTIESHAELIRTLAPTVIVGVPSFLKKLGLSMRRQGNDPALSSIRKMICIGEPLRNASFELTGAGKDLETIWNSKVFSTYAASETITTFCECSAQRGGHLIPELAVVEIVDEGGQVLPPGQTGEVVLTPMAVEAMPLIRYKTGDISFIETSPCSCGRFSVRLGPVLGRKHQRMKVKGTSLYPQAVFLALENLNGISHYYVEVRSSEDLSDDLRVFVSVEDPSLTAERIEELLAVTLRVKPRVFIEEEAAVKKKVFVPQSRKPLRFFDRRNEHA